MRIMLENTIPTVILACWIELATYIQITGTYSNFPKILFIRILAICVAGWQGEKLGGKKEQFICRVFLIVISPKTREFVD